MRRGGCAPRRGERDARGVTEHRRVRGRNLAREIRAAVDGAMRRARQCARATWHHDEK